MRTCEYCSHDNINNPGPCARCGVAGNPAGTPWGIRDRRSTKYWHKYNWNKQEEESATPQEHYNAVNHKELMDVIKPTQMSKAQYLTVKEPAYFKMNSSALERIEQIAENEQIPLDEGHIPEIQAVLELMAPELIPHLPDAIEAIQNREHQEAPRLEGPREQIQDAPQLEYESGGTYSNLRGTDYKFVVRPGQKFPIEFYHLKLKQQKRYGLGLDESGERKLLPRGLCLLQLANGMRIPFYSSSGANIKPGVDPSDWLPIFGMDYWFNKMSMYDESGTKLPYSECWGVKELKEVRKWLMKEWPAKRIINMIKHAHPRSEGIPEKFYSQMFIEKYPPLPSDSPSVSDACLEQMQKVVNDLKSKPSLPPPPPPPRDTSEGIIMTYEEFLGFRLDPSGTPGWWR